MAAAAKAELDAAVCKKLFSVLEKGSTFEESRLSWARFVRRDSASRAGDSALLVVRCDKSALLCAQVCLMPLGEGDRALWVSSLGAEALAAHFDNIGATVTTTEAAERLTSTFAETLLSKDTISYEEQSDGGLLLSMQHAMDDTATVEGQLCFALEAPRVAPLVADMLLDMAFALLGPEKRRAKHKEHMLSRAQGAGHGWQQTLEQEDTPLLALSQSQETDSSAAASSSQESRARAQAGERAKAKRRRPAAAAARRAPRRKGALFKSAADSP